MSSKFTSEQDQRLCTLYDQYHNGKKKFWSIIVENMNDEFKRERPFTLESLRSRSKILRNKNKTEPSTEEFPPAIHSFSR